MKNKLKTKDLIYIGAYSAIYMVVATVCTMILKIIAFFALYGLQITAGIFCASIYFLCAMKIKKFGAITTVGVLIGMMSGVAGHIYTLFLSLPIGFIADVIENKGNYQSKAMLNLSYIVFNLLTVTQTLNFLTAKDQVLEQYTQYYGEEYAKTLNELATTFMVVPQIILAIVGAMLGSFFANKLLEKHFKKAGVV